VSQSQPQPSSASITLKPGVVEVGIRVLSPPSGGWALQSFRRSTHGYVAVDQVSASERPPAPTDVEWVMAQVADQLYRILERDLGVQTHLPPE
jgi:hypothetical protein